MWPSAQTEWSIKDLDQDTVIEIEATPSAKPPAQGVTETPTTISTPDSIINMPETDPGKECEDYWSSYYSSMDSMWAGEWGKSCSTFWANRLKSKYSKLVFADWKICYKMDEVYCTEWVINTRTQQAQSWDESFIPTKTVTNPAPDAPIASGSNDNKPTFATPTAKAQQQEEEENSDDCPEDGIKKAWKQWSQTKCYQYHTSAIQQATNAAIMSMDSINYWMPVSDFSMTTVNDGTKIFWNNWKYYIKTDGGGANLDELWYQEVNGPQDATPKKNWSSLSESDKIFKEISTNLKQYDAWKLVNYNWKQYKYDWTSVTIDWKSVSPEMQELIKIKSEIQKLEAVNEPISGDKYNEWINDEAITDYKSELKKAEGNIPIMEKTSSFLKDNLATAGLNWIGQWVSYAMACQWQPWCSVMKVWLGTAATWFVWSYAGQAVWNMIWWDWNTAWEYWWLWAGVWAAVFAWWAAYMMCWKNNWEWLSDSQKEKIEKGCKKQAGFSAGTSIAAIWASYAAKEFIKEGATWVLGSIYKWADSVANMIPWDSISWWDVVWAWAASIVSWLAVLLQWWSPMQALMATAQSFVVSLASKAIASSLLSGTAFAWSAFAIWAMTMWIWLVLWLLLAKFMCPYYYVVLPDWSVILQWAFLVWKVGEKLKGDSYERVNILSLRGTKQSSVSNEVEQWEKENNENIGLQWVNDDSQNMWFNFTSSLKPWSTRQNWTSTNWTNTRGKSEWEQITIKLKEHFNEDLYLDSVSLLQVTHKKWEEVIIDKNWKVHLIGNAKELRFNAGHWTRDRFNLQNWTNNEDNERQNWTNNEHWTSESDDTEWQISNTAINLPKIESETDLIISWWISPEILLQTQTKVTKEQLSSSIPEWAVDPIYFIIDKFPFIWWLAWKLINNYEWINLEVCSVWYESCETIDTIITYPQEKRVFTLWKDLIWKDLRLRFNNKVVMIDNLWYSEPSDLKLETRNYKALGLSSELENTDNLYRVLRKWDELDLRFNVNEVNENNLEYTYYMKTNGFYHPRGVE